MKEYVPDTLFVHTKDTAHLLKRLNNHPCETVITPVLFDDLMANPEQILGGVEYVVVSGPIEIIKAVLQLSVQACFSLGIIPTDTDTQKKLALIYDLPRDIDAGIDLALDASPLTMDLVTCNGHPVLFKAPISILNYMKFLLRLLSRTGDTQRLPSAIGYLKSTFIEIEPETELDVFIDGEKETRTPLRCEIKQGALRVNVGPTIRKEAESVKSMAEERVEIDHLPRGNELIKAWKKEKIPFFSYASEERFHDLFVALREDSRINGLYLTLMVLSTMLAAAGLYLNSASVIIGAMLLAPLMAPIVALSMGILRGEEKMIKNSLIKIMAGIAIALFATDFFHYYSQETPFSKRAIAAHEGRGTSYTAMGVEGFSILLDAMNRCDDASDRECINREVRSTSQFEGLLGKISIGKNGKASRPVVINAIKNNKLEYIVKVY